MVRPGNILHLPNLYTDAAHFGKIIDITPRIINAVYQKHRFEYMLLVIFFEKRRLLHIICISDVPKFIPLKSSFGILRKKAAG